VGDRHLLVYKKTLGVSVVLYEYVFILAVRECLLFDLCVVYFISWVVSVKSK